jgi:hypothetical protein
MAKTTATVKTLSVDANVRSKRIIPIEDSGTACPAKHSKNWKGNTVALSLSKEEAIHLVSCFWRPRSGTQSPLQHFAFKSEKTARIR